ncbi:PAS domain-containing sensor histidine kinase [Hymenobacter sp. YC55]|uniref:PAS domain-containing sensor histidine kinase n=1 Tax=Hymenobacter sp. YC55 TaxID=3034019 RepID=UPI0023F65645|nr:PAS domain-containing sensor histidine kinase [Hymenobacter sp. YC55]MDF7813755.1 PAS domain-containing sensor histidine kinase [Hymenobacter sp. YC55]
MSYPLPFFASFLQQGPMLFFVYSLTQQRVLYVSPAYERVLHGTCARVNEELPALLARVHPDDQDHAADCWRRWQAGGLHEPFELRLRQPTGEDQHLCLTPHHLVGSDGETQVGGLVEDITTTKVMLWHADKYNSKKNTTLEILSHDLAGPFAMLQQMSDYFHEAMAPLQNPELVRMVEHMRQLCGDSVNLIRDFVDHEFLDSVHVELKRERVDLVEKLRLVMAQYQQGEPYVGKSFAFHVEQAPLYVVIDQNKLMQVINNLLSNALKFTPDGGTITVSLAHAPGQALVRVADTGVGIPEALHPTLFEKFTPARRPGLRGERSTGLGMSIIKTIVELHEGTIAFTSAEGQGTTFTLTLPLADEDPALR